MSSAELSEWRSWPPEGSSRGAPVVHLDDDPEVRRLAEYLDRGRMLRVRDLRTGLRLEATSYVGTLRLGSLSVIIRPKLGGARLLSLLRYAYGLRDLALFPGFEQETSRLAFQDLLIHQLEAELRELVRRGLHREYVRREEELTSPRGRIDLGWWMRHAGSGRATLRCSHHPRQEDHPLNQVLRAGLLLAQGLTDDVGLRTRLHRLDALMPGVQRVALYPALLERRLRETDRMTATYRPALSIIQVLLDARGPLQEESSHAVELPGFLFDMNRFFQELLSRFLKENLRDHTVRDEFRLVGMLAYAAAHNPRRRQPPALRPDFAILRGQRVLALLDAKYRDLWETQLPRDMLYQLTLYALSQGSTGSAAILYPTLTPEARDQVVELNDVVQGNRKATVVLRPVHLHTLVDLVNPREGVDTERERESFARRLALGEPGTV